MESRYLLVCICALLACRFNVVEGFRASIQSRHLLLTKSLRLSSASSQTTRLYGRAEKRMQKKANKGKQGVNTAEEEDEEDEDEDGRGFGAPAAGQGQVVDTEGVVMVPEKMEFNSNDPDAELDSIFRKYGINEAQGKQATEAQKRAILAGKEPKPEGGAFGESALSKIDGKMQQQIDDTLIALTFGSLAFCVLCGLAISSTAIEIVFPSYKMDSNIDYVLKDILTPMFTPSIGIFFFFSITFGIFKFAQVSSQATVYSEEDKKK